MKRGTQVILPCQHDGTREKLAGKVVETRGRTVVVELDGGRRVTVFASQCQVKEQA